MSRSLVATAAAVVVSVVACGKVETSKPADAPMHVADAAVDSGPHGIVSIKVLSQTGNGDPVVGAVVVFTDAHQTQRGVTDATGTATMTVGDNATLTVIGEGFGPGAAFLQTVFGAKPGDAIVLGAKAPDSTTLGSFTVNFTPVAGPTSSSYQAFGPCGEGSVGLGSGATSGSIQLSFESSCQIDPMEFVIVGTNNTTGASLGFLDKTGVSFVSGGSTTVAGAFAPFVNFSGSYTNADLATSLALDRFVPDNFGFESGATGTITGGTATITTPGPTASGAVAETEIGRTSFGSQTVLQRVPGGATTYALDVGASVLPWLAPPTYDGATRTIREPVDTAGSSGDAPDLFFAEMNYTRPSQTDGGAPTNLAWLLFAATPGDIVLPQLPPEVGDVAPQAGDTIDDIQVGSFETDQVPGYDQGRLDPYSFPSTLSEPRSVTGRARVTEVGSTAAIPLVRAGSRGRWSRPLGPRGAARAR